MVCLKATIDHLTVGKKRLCRDLHIHCQQGSFWCLLGPNGSGKTTLLHTLAGLRDADDATIYLDDALFSTIPAKIRAQRIGVLLQDQPVPFACTVLEGLRMARYPYYSTWQHQLNKTCESHIETILTAMDLYSLHHRYINELSGGEQQRFHIAMLLVQDPSVYILDEPTNHLDLRHQVQILHRLKMLAKEQGKIIIVALHDINLAYQFADHVCLLHENGETEAGKTSVLFDENRLSRLYQQTIKPAYMQNGRCLWVVD